MFDIILMVKMGKFYCQKHFNTLLVLHTVFRNGKVRKKFSPGSWVSLDKISSRFVKHQLNLIKCELISRMPLPAERVLAEKIFQSNEGIWLVKLKLTKIIYHILRI